MIGGSASGTRRQERGSSCSTRNSRCRQPRTRCQGRAEKMPVPPKHHVLNGARSSAPFPAGTREGDVRAGMLLGRREEVLAAAGRLHDRRRLRGGLHAEPDATAKSAAGMTGHNEVVLVVFDPKKISYDDLLKAFWESHNPTQGMRQGNDVGTQYRSGIYYYDDAQRAAAERTRDDVPAGAAQGAATARSPPRSCRRPSSTSPRTITSSTCRRIPTATAASAAPASAVPSASKRDDRERAGAGASRDPHLGGERRRGAPERARDCLAPGTPRRRHRQRSVPGTAAPDIPASRRRP